MTIKSGEFFRHESLVMPVKSVENLLLNLCKKKQKPVFVFICDRLGTSIFATEIKPYKNIDALESCVLCEFYYKIAFDSVGNLSLIPVQF